MKAVFYSESLESPHVLWFQMPQKVAQGKILGAFPPYFPLHGETHSSVLTGAEEMQGGRELRLLGVD